MTFFTICTNNIPPANMLVSSVIHLKNNLFPPGKNRRITFIECNTDINCMIDVGKIADLVRLLRNMLFSH